MFDTTRGLTSRSTSPGKLSFFAWNIHGVISNMLGNKLQSSDFLRMINGSDFIFLTETCKCTDVQVRGYRSIIKNAIVSKNGGRNSRGIDNFNCQNIAKFSLVYNQQKIYQGNERYLHLWSLYSTE